MAKDNDKKMTGTVTCPNCGQEYRITLWGLVKTDENPRIASRIINGQFFIHKCKHCGKKMNADHQVAYEDVDNKAIICYTSSEIEALKAEAAMAEHNCPGYQMRIVTSQESLREKARAFQMGVDDRVIEILKIFLLKKFQDDVGATDVEDIFIWVNDDMSMKAEVWHDEDDADSILMPSDFYSSVFDTAKELLKTCDPREVKIDIEWAMNLLHG